jgi:hypothetical protein
LSHIKERKYIYKNTDKKIKKQNPEILSSFFFLLFSSLQLDLLKDVPPLSLSTHTHSPVSPMPSSYAAAPISLSQNGRREKREKRREKTIDHPRVSLGEPTNKKKKGRKMKRRTKQNERRQRGTHASKEKKKRRR